MRNADVHVSISFLGGRLRDLWYDNIDFQDTFCRALDKQYKSGIKNWRHLAERFEIPALDYENFSGPGNNSPSEKLLEYSIVCCVKTLCTKI